MNVKGIERIDVFPLAHLTTIPRQLLTSASFFVRLPRRNENRINQEWETAFFPLFLRRYVAETIRLEKLWKNIFYPKYFGLSRFAKKFICENETSFYNWAKYFSALIANFYIVM